MSRYAELVGSTIINALKTLLKHRSESFWIIDDKTRENTASFKWYRINPLHHDKTKDEVVNIHQFMNEDEFEKVGYIFICLFMILFMRFLCGLFFFDLVIYWRLCWRLVSCITRF